MEEEKPPAPGPPPTPVSPTPPSEYISIQDEAKQEFQKPKRPPPPPPPLQTSSLDRNATPPSTASQIVVEEPIPTKSKEKEKVKVQPLTVRNSFFRLDVLPFLIAYISLIYLDASKKTSEKDILSLYFPSCLFLHLLLFLGQHWSISVQKFVGFYQGKKWTHALVANKAIVELKFESNMYKATYQDVVYIYSAEDDDFKRLDFPVDWTIQSYLNSKGHSPQTFATYRAKYALNQTKITTPSLLTLLEDQLLAPFFLFQVFCVCLWCLDEYWYYAIFTLLTLVLFELSISYNRQKSLVRLRETLKGSYNLYVYRFDTWVLLSTEDLVAGDIVSLSQIDQHVPCDVLLIGGGNVLVNEAMLTGESVPQIKESLLETDFDRHLNVDDAHFKKSLVYGGTTILNISSCSHYNIQPPVLNQNCAIGFVLRTGFETEQGQLLRTMIHSTDKLDGVNTRDTFVFIFMLLLCAIAAALLVLEHGWYDDTRNKFKLVLHVVIIITSVVPPELPMELSLAVTSSLSDLIHFHVFCTEPWRIPLAGKVDTCCFDKTGTLTSDELRVRGLRVADSQASITCLNNTKHGGNDDLVSPDAVPLSTLRVLVGCQSIALAKDKTIIGDPLDKAMISSCNWALSSEKQNVVLPVDSQLSPVAIIHKWAFESRLKRMTCIIQQEKKYFVVCKGAPETIKPLLASTSIPSNYDKVYRFHMSLGQRVIALAQKEVPAKLTSLSNLQKQGRSFFEQQLHFAGFLILDCPLKSDTFHVINELKASSHGVVMITGDSPLTAAEVARQVGIIDTSHGDTYELREFKNLSKSVFVFVPITAVAGEYTPEQTIAFVPENISKLRTLVKSNEVALCVSGDVLTKLVMNAMIRSQKNIDEKMYFLKESQAILQSLVPLIAIFARHSPTQKEAVIFALNQTGCTTMMCGDGTNDVGALKHAHVGISIISMPAIEAKERKTKETLMTFRNKKKKKNKAAERSLLKELAETQDELNYVALGDASVASPFTSRTMSIICCKHVIQQGRCTLVTMIQIYKILGVNCLVNALVLSYLHMYGVKQGDRQLTCIGIVVALLFFFVTKGKPLYSLSPKRPPSSILCVEALLSILLQFLIHWGFILVVTNMSLPFLDPDDPSIIPDGPFNPNILNTCTFLMTCMATCNTFAVNYRGRPFMQGLSENKFLKQSILVCVFLILVCASESFEPLNQLLQLSALPDEEELKLVEALKLQQQQSSDHVIHPLLRAAIDAVGFKGVLCNALLLDCFISYFVENFIVKKIL